MRIAVCVKQVPSGAADMDAQSGVLLRSGAGGIILNPWDLPAIEAALRAAEAFGTEATALSMGPASAGEALREALAMGVGRGVLLCDQAFSGADVYATAYTLAEGMKALGGFDLVFCGLRTADGDTAQLPFSLAVQLGAHAAGWVKRIERVDECGVTVLQELSFGTQRLTLPYPAVIALGREAAEPRAPTLKNRLAARKARIETISMSRLANRDEACYGLAASPTRVVRVFKNDVAQITKPLGIGAREAAALLLREMEEAQHG
ncbi:MAG TPA: electron transfer flavoprotein subunit beta/FixA family protein [Clostridia bacterium]|nr:electron transfer flavoprotein subunit beta/FixA family protein [Clostridia bacterium]